MGSLGRTQLVICISMTISHYDDGKRRRRDVAAAVAAVSCRERRGNTTRWCALARRMCGGVRFKRQPPNEPLLAPVCTILRLVLTSLKNLIFNPINPELSRNVIFSRLLSPCFLKVGGWVFFLRLLSFHFITRSSGKKTSRPPEPEASSNRQHLDDLSCL